MRVFLSEVMFDKDTDGKGKRVSIPFGKNDCAVFRKVMSTEDMVQEFAPTLKGMVDDFSAANPNRSNRVLEKAQQQGKHHAAVLQ